MKTKLFLLMLFAASTLSAQNKLTIIVDGIENAKGHVIAGLYNKDNFLRQPLFGQQVKVEAETVRIVFENVPAGEYAVSLFQDENDNGKLDTGLFGIPTEKYGFSNNAKGKFGPPAYKDCRFVMNGDMEMAISL